VSPACGGHTKSLASFAEPI